MVSNEILSRRIQRQIATKQCSKALPLQADPETTMQNNSTELREPIVQTAALHQPPNAGTKSKELKSMFFIKKYTPIEHGQEG